MCTPTCAHCTCYFSQPYLFVFIIVASLLSIQCVIGSDSFSSSLPESFVQQFPFGPSSSVVDLRRDMCQGRLSFFSLGFSPSHSVSFFFSLSLSLSVTPCVRAQLQRAISQCTMEKNGSVRIAELLLNGSAPLSLLRLPLYLCAMLAHKSKRGRESERGAS